MAGQGDSYTVYLYSIWGQGSAANCGGGMSSMCEVKIRTIVHR